MRTRQLMIELQPEGRMSPSPTMSLSAKARFQGTPVSTLKAVPVSDAWLQTLVQQDVRDPKLSIGAGPAQYWRFRFATLSDGSLAPKPPTTPSRRLKPVGVLKEGEAIAEDIRVAFATYDVDSSGDMDLKELEQALQHLGIETLPSGKFHPDAAEIMARYDTEGKGLGLGRIRLAEFNALCLDALAAGEELAKSGFTSDVIQLKVSDESSPSELLIEAVDAEGNVDTDFYSSTLLELDSEATEKHNGAAAVAEGQLTAGGGAVRDRGDGDLRKGGRGSQVARGAAEHAEHEVAWAEGQPARGVDGLLGVEPHGRRHDRGEQDVRLDEADEDRADERHHRGVALTVRHLPDTGHDEADP